MKDLKDLEGVAKKEMDTEVDELAEEDQLTATIMMRKSILLRRLSISKKNMVFTLQE
jgi:hypothetical protein